MVKVTLPELGEGIEKATVSYWFFQEQDKVEANADLVELVTDKATFNLPSPATGVLSKILFREGQTVKVGDILAEIN